MSKQLSEDLHFRMLRMLNVKSDLSQRQIARELGVSLGAVNYCLHALVEKGQIKVRNFSSSDKKMRYAYILTPRGMTQKAKLTSAFLKRKLIEYEALKSEIEAVEAELRPKRG